MPYNWKSDDAEMAAFYAASASESGEAGYTNPLPYRFYTLRKQDVSNRWTATANRTVYRFFGDVRSVVKPLSNGKEYVDLRCDGINFRQQLTQSLWNDLAEIPSQEIPSHLHEIPVPGWTPLAKAIGLMKNGRPDPFLLEQPGQRPKYHPVNGVPPARMYWAAVHVTQYFNDKDGQPTTSEGVGILLLKSWQVQELLKTVDNWREMLGSEWSASGFPMHIINLDLPKPQYGLKITKAGAYNPDDAVVYDMQGLPQVDFDAQANTVIEELERLLADHGCPLRGWPEPDSNPNGWWTDRPLVVLQREQLNSSALDDGGLPVPAEAVAEVVIPDRWEKHTDEELLDLATEYGAKIPVRNRTRAKLIAAIEDAQSKF